MHALDGKDKNEPNADPSKVVKVDQVKGLKKKRKRKKKPKQDVLESNGQHSKPNGVSGMECDKDSSLDNRSGTAAKT